jgi:hypothetical protein
VYGRVEGSIRVGVVIGVLGFDGERNDHFDLTAGLGVTGAVDGDEIERVEVGGRGRANGEETADETSEKMEVVGVEGASEETSRRRSDIVSSNRRPRRRSER